MTGGTAILFRTEGELAAGLGRAIAEPRPAEVAELARAARERASRVYSWDAVADAYEAVLVRLASARGTRSSRR